MSYDDLLGRIERAIAGAIVDIDAAAYGLGEREASIVRRAAMLAREMRRQRSVTTSVSQFAGAITSVRGADSALQQLVARTRSLAGADMAYVSLNDDDGTGRTRIVETDGVWTEAYRQLRMPLGAGVLGRVAQAGGPVQTIDYASDDGLVHDPDVDAIVAAEGVRAILGAPLWIDGRVVGALLVANRHTHRFDEEEIFIVSTLASLAAVAIDNVRWLGELEAEVEARGERARELEAHVAQQQRRERIDDALLGALRTGGGLHELRSRIPEALGRPARVVDLTVRFDLADGGGALPARGGGEAGGGEASGEALSASERGLLAASQSSGAPAVGRRDGGGALAGGAGASGAARRADGAGGPGTPRGPGDPGGPDAAGDAVTVMVARRGRDAIGAVVVGEAVPEAEWPLLQRTAEVVAAFIVAEERARGDIAERRRELIEQLVAPPVGGIAAATMTRLAEFGVRPAGPFRLLLAAGSPAALMAFDHRLELDYGRSLLRAELDGQLIAVVPEAAFTRIEAAVEAGRAGRAWRGLRISHSPALHDFAVIPPELDLVEKVLEASTLGGGAEVLVSLRSYGAIGSFLSKVHLAPTRRMIDGLIGELIDYDREQGTPLVETAFAYLDSGHAVSEVASRLHVHKNTVRQRLDRVASILGPGWAEGQAGLDHHIVLAAHRVLGDDASGSAPYIRSR